MVYLQIDCHRLHATWYSLSMGMQLRSRTSLLRPALPLIAARRSILSSQSVKSHDVTIVTQNVDNLHERAGSSRVVHLHGELAKVTSSKNREDTNCIKEYPLDTPIRIGDKAADGSQLRPYIVWFGEYLNTMSEAIRLVEYADIFIVIGTSLVVYPAAGLVDYAHPEVPKFLIDPSNMEGKLPARFKHIQATAVEGVDILLEELKKL